VEEHLLDPTRFWLPVPVATVDAAEASFARTDMLIPGLKRYWRGPTWINSSWLLWIGLMRLGYTEEAELLTRRLSDTVRAHGLREYYDPFNGRGMGAYDFAWSSLIMELSESQPSAAQSYLT
jgi:glycogen debranching enzyme